MQAAANVGFVLAVVGLGLALGIPISMRVYGSPARSVPVFTFVAKVALVAGVVGAALLVIGLATGNGPA